MRVAIYARFSSDLQRDRSVDDQLALCRAHALREGWTVARSFEDRARSGASIHGRDGLAALLQAAGEGAFDAVLVESLDRISRDQEDLAGIYKRLRFRGIDLIAVHEGKADQISVGVRGIVGALYLTDLAQKVRRGMTGVIQDGRHAGGRAYGYRPIKGEPGQLAIVAHEADVIRRIFSDYVAGVVPRQIAHTLNAEGVPPPRGTYWQASVINGNEKRRDGIIQNEIYVGTIVWNRVRMIKDPDTGKRISRVNPDSEWQRASAPHLRIIDDDTWAAARALKAERATVMPTHRRKPKYLLFGLLRCYACGSGLQLKGMDGRLICTRAKEAGTCTATQSYKLSIIESAVLEGLQKTLKERSLIDYYLRVYNKERQRLARSARQSAGDLANRLATIEGEIKRTVQMAVKGVIDEAEAAATLPPLRAERDRLKAELDLAHRDVQVVALHPKAIEKYIAAIDDLSAALASPDAGNRQAADAIRELVDRVVVGPAPARQGNKPARPQLKVHGRLEALIGGADPFTSVRDAAPIGGCVVAGARYIASPNHAPFIFGA